MVMGYLMISHKTALRAVCRDGFAWALDITPAAVDILNEQNLWRHVTHIPAQRLMVLSIREQELMGWILI